MCLKNTHGFNYGVFGNTDKNHSCIYYLGLSQELSDTKKLTELIDCTVVYIEISMNDWDNLLTPWSAPGLYRNDPDFEGKAPEFLKTLLNYLIPSIERNEALSPKIRAIAGYSLAGLFSTYAFANCDAFKYVATMSGSFWYKNWVDYISSLKLDKKGCGAYISLGDKECKAKEKILHSVEENTNITAEALESWGVNVQNHLVPGGHFDHIYERVYEGLAAISKIMSCNC